MKRVIGHANHSPEVGFANIDGDPEDNSIHCGVAVNPSLMSVVYAFVHLVPVCVILEHGNTGQGSSRGCTRHYDLKIE